MITSAMRQAGTTYQLIYVHVGRGVFYYGGDAREPILENNLYLITPLEERTMVCHSDSPLDCFQLRFDFDSDRITPQISSELRIRLPSPQAQRIFQAMLSMSVRYTQDRFIDQSSLIEVFDALDMLIQKTKILFAARHIGRMIGSIKRHTHILEHQIDFFAGGSGRYWVNDKWENISEGDLFYITPNTPHEIQYEQNSALDNFVIKFVYGADYADELGISSCKVGCEGNEMESVLESLKVIVGNYTMEQPVPPDALPNVLRIIKRSVRLENAIREGNEAKVERVKDLIRTNYSRSLRLPWLAEQVGMKPEYLSRIFPKISGQTLSKYIMEVRLKKSVGFLENDGVPIKEVAASCGFSNVHYFASSFKKRYRFTPKVYRDKRRKESIDE
jgi:AraC-like DNA-binding protein